MGNGRGSQTDRADGAGAKPVVASGLICRQMHPALSPRPSQTLRLCFGSGSGLNLFVKVITIIKKS